MVGRRFSYDPDTLDGIPLAQVCGASDVSNPSQTFANVFRARHPEAGGVRPFFTGVDDCRYAPTSRLALAGRGIAYDAGTPVRASHCQDDLAELRLVLQPPLCLGGRLERVRAVDDRRERAVEKQLGRLEQLPLRPHVGADQRDLP